ncbi:MAG TPA: tRNA uridine-5-carboxymethylaminomethyl(34) synthesis GTPase MnmE [Gemmatimonadaceae bacterium]|nr:tRNA uridine-5-carboxymethylaminomethyl(34) synthesis GTPase MnmE [Gemmatimonadaceae bacterium]
MTSSPGLGQSIAGGCDTIVALGTAPGRSAIAVVRLSGEDAFGIAAKHIDPWPADSREASLCTVHDSGWILDQAIVTVYVRPYSFTGEDVVEISTHGGHTVPASVIAALIGSGAREALPGEFTRRAVLNGKLDIVQAEAIGDLIDAESHAMQQVALGQLEGGLSSRIASIRESVLSLESLLAYDIDFPEEDDGPVSRDRVLQSANRVLESLDILLATIPVGQIVREGAITVIAGEPNAGKSSLFNTLLGENRAIVTEIPGTTRDALEGVIDAGRWPIRLIDTAGLRESGDVVELLGIEMSERYVARAHILLACGESKDSMKRVGLILSRISSAPVISVLTKSDLCVNEMLERSDAEQPRYISVSAVTGEGLDRLQNEIDVVLTETYGELTPELPVLVRARHVQGINVARAEIAEFKSVWTAESLPAPVAAVHLRTAAIALETLIGAVSTEDVLERVFSAFCVGK